MPWSPTSLAGPVALLALMLCPALAAAQIREEVKQAKEPQLTRPPSLARFVPADYPPELKEEGIDGTVEMLIELDAAGKVTSVQVTESPDPRFSAAAEAAVRQFAFTPAEWDGKPGPIRVKYAYNFVLDVEMEPELPAWMEDTDYRGLGDAPLVGRVREAGTRLPLPGVAVFIRKLGVEVKADETGRFRLPEVPPGSHKVQAVSLEHKPGAIEAEVREGEQTRITFYLESAVDNPYETVVRGERRKTVVTRVTLKQKELTTVPGTFGDPVRVLENLPGMARLPYVGGALIIRGSAPGDSGVYLDGTEIPLIYHFLGGPSVLNPEFLDRIDYYPGNAEVRYGRLQAGVVDVHTRNTFTEQWHGAVDINLINASVMVRAPVHEKVSVAAAARRSYIDALLPSIFDAAGQEATAVAPVYYDYQLRVDVKLGGDNSLFVLFFGSDDQLEIVSNEEDADLGVTLDSHTAFHRVLAGWRHYITDDIKSTLIPSAGFNLLRFGLGGLNVDFTTVNFLLREDIEMKLRPWVTLRVGVDFELEQLWADTVIPQPADYRIPGSGTTRQFTQNTQDYTIDAIQYGVGLYSDAVVQLTDKLQVIPGLRFDVFHFFGNTRVSLSPRLTARYKLLPGTTLKGAAGMYTQEPSLREADERFGNPGLGLRQAVHASAGFEQKIIENLSLDVQGYLLYRYDQVLPTEALSRDGAPLRYVNLGEGYSYGMELLLKHDVTERFYGWISYTLSQSKEQQEVGGAFLNYVFDQTHILTLVASLRVGFGIEVGSRFRLVSGRPDTPILGGVYDADADLYRAITGDINSTRLPLFHQLDLRIEKTWIFDLWRLSLYLDIQNLYNAKNAEAILWDYRFSESGPLQGLPLLPTLGIKGSF